MKSILIPGLSSLLLVFAAGAATAALASEPAARTVEAALPVIQPMPEEIVVTGTLVANEWVRISPEIAGTVKSLPFEEGGHISKGDLILELDDALLAAQLRQAQASFDLAKLRHDRDRELVKRKSISQAVFDESAAELNERQAALEVSQVRLDKTRIRAPFDGYISLRDTSVGAYVTPGEHLLILVDDSVLKLDFRVPERIAGAVKPGTRVTFQIQSDGNGHDYQATVRATQPAITPNSRTLLARASYANDQRKILSGSFAMVKLTLSQADPVATIPEQALTGSAHGYRIFVVEDGMAIQRDVTVGVRRDGRVAIMSGLAADEPVIIAGQQLVREGSPVNVVMTRN
jgi:membrane fusion protein, multidrug efflux system